MWWLGVKKKKENWMILKILTGYSVTGRCVVFIIKTLLATINYTFTTQSLPPKKALRKRIVQPGVLLLCISAAQTVISHCLFYRFYFSVLFSFLPILVWKSRR